MSLQQPAHHSSAYPSAREYFLPEGSWVDTIGYRANCKANFIQCQQENFITTLNWYKIHILYTLLSQKLLKR